MLQYVNLEENTRILLIKNTTVDQRLYNIPTANEAAVILINGFPSEETRSPYIVVWGKSDKSQRIYHYYGCYDPLQYPILFPKGEWIASRAKKSLRCQRFYRDYSFQPLVPDLAHSADDLLMDEAFVKSLYVIFPP